MLARATRDMLVLSTMLFCLAACSGGGGDGGGGNGNGNGTEVPDNVPDPFSFAAVDDVAPASSVESSAVTIRGIDADAPVSITSGEYSIDGGAFTSSNGTVSNGQTLVVRIGASAGSGTSTEAAITVGGVSATFTVTTRADVAAPAVTILFPPPVSRTSGDTVYLRGTAADDLGTVAAVRVNGVDAVTNDAYATWRAEIAVAPGQNMLTVESEDAAGNIDSSASQISVTSNGRFGRVTGIAYDDATATAYVTDSAIGGLWKADLDPTGDEGLRTILFDRGSPDASNVVIGPEAVLLEGGRALVAGHYSIVSVDLATGARTVLSDSTTPDATNGFGQIQAMALDEQNNRLIVADVTGPRVLAVDLATGARSILSDPSTPDDTNLFTQARAIAIDRNNNRALIANSSPDAIYAVDLTTGARAILSDNTTPNGDNPLAFPTSIAVDPANGRALVGQWDTILSIDLASGAREVFSNPAIPDTKNPFVFLWDVAMDEGNGRLLAADRRTRRVYAVSLTDGSRTVVSYDEPPEVARPLRRASGLALDLANQRALVADSSQGMIVELDLNTLERSVLSDDATPDGANPLVVPERFAVDLASNRAFVLNNPPVADPYVLAVDLLTGARTLLSSDTVPDPANPLDDPYDIALDAANSRLLVSERSSSSVLAVDISTGARTIFSDNSTPGSAKSFDGPQAIVVDGDNGRALIGDTRPLTTTSSLLAANLSTGARSVLSADGTPDSSNRFSNVHGVTLDYANNRVLLADRAQLFAIDLPSGARTVLSESAPPDHINPLGVTEGIAYDPATEIVYVVDGSFSAVTAIDTVTGRRVYMLK